jgi:hypothetical protein
MGENSSDDQSVREHAAKLHTELTAALQSNPGVQEALGDTLHRVQRLTQEPANSPAARASLTERLEGIAVHFEADHPTLAASARRLIDLLGEVGI